jgi:urea transport system substrate-binding protein
MGEMDMSRINQKTRGKWIIVLLIVTLVLSGCVGSNATNTETADSGGEAKTGKSGETVKVGILHSLSGTMAISEVSLKNAELMRLVAC